MRSDPIIREHVDFRVIMAQSDDNQTPNMAQDADEDMSQDNSQTPPPTPPLPPTPSTPPP